MSRDEDVRDEDVEGRRRRGTKMSGMSMSRDENAGTKTKGRKGHDENEGTKLYRDQDVDFRP